MTSSPFPDYTPPTAKPQAQPPAPVTPPPEDRNNIDPDYVPPGVVQEEAQHFLFAWLKAQGPHRGIFKVEKDPANQQFPGVSLPPWLITLLNQISGHPALGYNHDRTTMHRDLLFLAVAAIVQVLSQYDKSDEQKQAVHIVRAQAALRQELFVEELMLNFTEDLGITAGLLTLKIRAKATAAVYEQLRKLFHHIEQTQDKEFWRPLLLKLTLAVPEVREALMFLNDSDFYRYDQDLQAWLHILSEMQEREHDDNNKGES